MDCGQNGSMLKSLQFTKVKGGCVMSKKVVYNHKPDPVVSVKEYEIDGNGKMVLVKNNTYEEALKSDPLLLAEQRMLLNQQMDNS